MHDLAPCVDATSAGTASKGSQYAWRGMSCCYRLYAPWKVLFAINSAYYLLPGCLFSWVTFPDGVELVL